MRQQQLFLLQQQQAQQQQQQEEEMIRQQQLFQMQQQQLQNQRLSAGDSSTHWVFLPHLFSLTKAHAIYLRSNNPFAPSPVPSGFNPSPRPTQQQGSSPSSKLPRTYETHSPFRVSSLSSFHAPTQNQNQNRPIQVKTKKELGKNEAHLAALFANRDDGQDTFGNIGALRCGILFFCLLPWV